MGSEGVHGFDFLHGRWEVASRVLATRLAGSTDWVEFPGTAVCRPFFDGAGNVDEFIFPTRGASGMTLRLFDREREQWFIYWADSRTGRLGPPRHQPPGPRLEEHPCSLRPTAKRSSLATSMP